MTMSVIMFWIFAAMAIVGAGLVAFLGRLVNSAFALVLSLVGVAGLYWTLGADFIGTTQILIYVGGVTILLLYAVMLTPKDSTRVPLIRFIPAGVLTLAVGYLLLTAFNGVKLAIDELGGGALDEPPPTADQIGRAFLERDAYLLPFELASVLLLIVVVGAVFIARRKREV
jgi:NADH:ubiquinone oxidoreductase subunit 6 (subunit J)